MTSKPDRHPTAAPGADPATVQSAPGPTRPQTTDTPRTATPLPAAEPPTRAERREVRHRQKERFGGIKWGSAFFGWLTAVGTAVLLSGIVAVAGTGFGTAAGGPTAPVLDAGAVSTVGIVSAVVVAVVLFLAYFCGGYVAGRMARFDGAKQGIAVWLWAIVVVGVIAALVAISGVRLDLVPASGLVGLPTDPATLTTGGIVAAVVALLVGLLGAIAGGLAGMRFHRRVDRATSDIEHAARHDTAADGR